MYFDIWCLHHAHATHWAHREGWGCRRRLPWEGWVYGQGAESRASETLQQVQYKAAVLMSAFWIQCWLCFCLADVGEGHLSALERRPGESDLSQGHFSAPRELRNSLLDLCIGPQHGWLRRLGRLEGLGSCCFILYPALLFFFLSSSIDFMKPSQPHKHGELGRHFVSGDLFGKNGRIVTRLLWVSEHGTWCKKKFLTSSEAWSVSKRKRNLSFKAKTSFYSLAG